MKVEQVKKAIADLQHLIKQPSQRPEVKKELQSQIDKHEKYLKDMKKCMFGKGF